MIPNYDLIRVDVIESLQRYVEQRIPTGGFLQAVLENNLQEAFGLADEDNCAMLFHICAYIYNELPSMSHGSPERVQKWLARRKARA
jgi:hypothetical protein